MTLVFSQCMACTRFRYHATVLRSCEAYPAGIPVPIFHNEVDHRVPQPGDHGLQYDQRPDEWGHPLGPDPLGELLKRQGRS